MASIVGRSATIEKGGSLIAGVKTKSFSFDNGAIEITSDDDAGFMTYDDEVGVRSLEISVSGVMKDTTLLLIAAGTGSKLLTDITIDFTKRFGGASGSPLTISGNFLMENFKFDAEDGDKITFEMTLKSSGAWVFTNETA